MNETVTLPAPAVDFPPAPRNKWEREFQAFNRLLPQLLATHRGQFVAIHDEQVVDSGTDKLGVALRVLTKIGSVAIHVGHVTQEPEPIAHSGLRREMHTIGDAS